MHFSIASALAAALCIVSASARLTSDQQNAINIQNEGRTAKGLPSLVWDDALEGTAQQCADKIAASGDFAHCQAGENLYAQWGSTAPPLAAGARAWMDEASNYDGQVIPQGNFESYGHYSKCPILPTSKTSCLWFRFLTRQLAQSMWKSTSKIGMALAVGSNGWTYVVAHYDPVGNM